MRRQTLNHGLWPVLAAGCVVLATGASPGAEAPLPVSAKLSADLASTYVWRGQVLTADPVLQPGVTATWQGLSLNVWSSFDITDIHEGDDQDWHLQEIDYTVSYAFSPVEGLDLTAGGIVYEFPGTVFDNTTELFASAALSKVPLCPTLTVYQDVDETEGLYANAALGHTFSLTEALSLALGAGLGYGSSDYHRYYFGVGRSALSDLAGSATLSYAVSEWASVSLYARYSELLDPEIEDGASAAYGASDAFVGGLNVTVSF